MATNVILWWREAKTVLPGVYADSTAADAGIARFLKSNPTLAGVKKDGGSTKSAAATIDKVNVTVP